MTFLPCALIDKIVAHLQINGFMDGNYGFNGYNDIVFRIPLWLFIRLHTCEQSPYVYCYCLLCVCVCGWVRGWFHTHTYIHNYMMHALANEANGQFYMGRLGHCTVCVRVCV